MFCPPLSLYNGASRCAFVVTLLTLGMSRIPTPRLLERGGFADVFDLGDGTVVKLFRETRHTHDPEAGSDEAHDLITERLADTEAAAYKVVSKLVSVRRHIPTFHGRINPKEIGPIVGGSTNRYVGLGIQLDLIPGRGVKAAHLPKGIQTQVESVLDEISQAVPDINVWDSSCFVPGLGNGFTLIDFSFWDGYGEATEDLSYYGHFRPVTQKRWGL